jgi:hypothetical protein
VSSGATMICQRDSAAVTGTAGVTMVRGCEDIAGQRGFKSNACGPFSPRRT